MVGRNALRLTVLHKISQHLFQSAQLTQDT